jgi:hypothetical protein
MKNKSSRNSKQLYGTIANEELNNLKSHKDVLTKITPLIKFSPVGRKLIDRDKGAVSSKKSNDKTILLGSEKKRAKVALKQACFNSINDATKKKTTTNYKIFESLKLSKRANVKTSNSIKSIQIKTNTNLSLNTGHQHKNALQSGFGKSSFFVTKRSNDILSSPIFDKQINKNDASLAELDEQINNCIKENGSLQNAQFLYSSILLLWRRFRC